MNPYREIEHATLAVERGRTQRRVRRKTAGYLLLALGTFGCPLAIGHGTWAVVLLAVVFVAAITLAFAGRSRSAFVRLCALTWNRGDRFGATLLFFGVVTPRHSAKRIARNRAALAAAQVGMPKMRTFAGPFVSEDNDDG